MLNLEELQQLTAFEEEGTLSQAAEKLHISQPTITRTMQRLEEEFGVPLFVRGKNRIAFNETGRQAAACARQLLDAAAEALTKVREFDRRLHTITVSSCAPAPLWQVMPALSAAYPGMTLSASLKDTPAVWTDLRSQACRLAILPCQVSEGGYLCAPFLQEKLSVCVPPSHELAGKAALTFSDLNGFNFLLRSEIGFWDRLCRRRMPSSRFLVQTDDFAFQELIRESSLPCFTTDLATEPWYLQGDRIQIPLDDPDAQATYFLACRPEDRAILQAVARPDQKLPRTGQPPA